MGEQPSGERQPASQDLAAAIHETTNALIVILGWIERAKTASGSSPEALAALRHAGRYTRSARDGMRRALGADVPGAGPEQAVELAIRTIDDLSVEAKRGAVAIDWTADPASRRCFVARPDVAWQVLTNLMLNAIAVTPRGGSVKLTLSCSGSSLCFVVEDEGPGIAPELRDNLFDAGVSRRAGGVGIGLRHAHSLAAEASGALRLADSTTGARLELTWPIATEPTRTAKPPLNPPAAGSRSIDGTRVLLLEDDAAVVEILELSLGARGADVTAVSTAEALRNELDSGQYDVVLVDLSPLTDGDAPPEDSSLDQAIERAREGNPDIGVVVISGSVTVKPRPGITWVRKPFEPRELIDAILGQSR